MCHKQVDKETVVEILALQVLIESHLLSVIHYFILTSVADLEDNLKVQRQQNPQLSFCGCPSLCDFETRSTVVKAKSQFCMLKANQQLLNPIPHAGWTHWIKVIKGDLMHLGSSVRAAISERAQYDMNWLLF